MLPGPPDTATATAPVISPPASLTTPPPCASFIPLMPAIEPALVTVPTPPVITTPTLLDPLPIDPPARLVTLPPAPKVSTPTQPAIAPPAAFVTSPPAVRSTPLPLLVPPFIEPAL